MPARRTADPLERYREMRDFTKTPEPKGAGPLARKRPTFLVQRHRASTLHYDFRLEVDGVLKSWSVPKGPSLDPKDKRLAIATEDHPLEYGDFEGVIPEGEYGAGTVIVWDRGTYRNLTERGGKEVPPAQALRNGRFSFWLEGKKLRGGFALTRLPRGGRQESWLLVKMRDEHARDGYDIVAKEAASVISGRTNDQLGAAPSRPSRRQPSRLA